MKFEYPKNPKLELDAALAGAAIEAKRADRMQNKVKFLVDAIEDIEENHANKELVLDICRKVKLSLL